MNGTHVSSEKKTLEQQALDQLFVTARSINVWTDRPIPEALLRRLYELTSLGPTSANCSPARFVFVQTQSARHRLADMMMAGNDEKVRSAPVTVIIGYDRAFAEKLPELFPHNPGAQNWFSDPDVAEETAFRNGSLQGGYLMLAARALGLDCGPMSGFDKEKVREAYFAGTTVEPNFICSIGYGSAEGIFPRSPRLSFEDAVRLL